MFRVLARNVASELCSDEGEGTVATTTLCGGGANRCDELCEEQHRRLG